MSEDEIEDFVYSLDADDLQQKLIESMIELEKLRSLARILTSGWLS